LILQIVLTFAPDGASVAAPHPELEGSGKVQYSPSYYPKSGVH